MGKPVALKIYGAKGLGPENFSCCVLAWEEEARIIPVWISPAQAAHIEARMSGHEPRRPEIHEVTAHIIRSVSDELTLTLTNYFEGVFVATLNLGDGKSFDLKASDAILLSLELDIPLYADLIVLREASLFIPAEEMEETLGFSIAKSESAEDIGESRETEDREDSSDFEEFMKNLGVSEEDLHLNLDETPETNDTQDGSGEEGV